MFGSTQNKSFLLESDRVESDIGGCLDRALGKDTESPEGVPYSRYRMHPEKPEMELCRFRSGLILIRPPIDRPINVTRTALDGLCIDMNHCSFIISDA